MKTRIIICLMIFICFFHARAQSLFILNTSYYRSPLVTYQNPAPLVFLGRTHASVGIHLLHAGLEGDNLRNNFASVALPIGKSTMIGLRAQYFTSNIFQKGNYSVLLSQKIYKDLLAIGINTNVLTHGYDTDQFKLFDFHDPLVQDGTSHSAFSFGFGILLQPISGILLGLSMNHLNEPDISLNNAGVVQERVTSIGISTSKFVVNPAFDVRIEGKQTMTQGGLRARLVGEKAELFGGYYKVNEEGSGYFVHVELNLGDIGLWYNFQNPLMQDFSAISSGSHQIGIFFTKSKIPPRPKVVLREIPGLQQTPQVQLDGVAENKDGLDYIEIKNNEKLVKRISCKDKAATERFSEEVSLEEGRNVITVTAFSGKVFTSEKTFSMFEPPAPEVIIASLKNTQVKDQNYDLHLIITDVNGIDKIKILHNGREMESLAGYEGKKTYDISQPVKLQEGENKFKILVSNNWKTTEISCWLVYQPKEPVPILTIDSPQKPISPSSSITVNLQLNNYDKIEQVIIKVNGIAVDTIKVYKTKGLGGVLESRFEGRKVVNLKAAQNLVEAIAYDKSNIPRTSRTMDILFNPYTDDFKYSRKRAFIIGVDHYRDQRITQLDQAVSDAQSVATILKNRLGFDQVDTLMNENATFENIASILSDTLLHAKPNDLILFYFSGHGDQRSNPLGEEIGYILPNDVDLTSVSKKISMSFINDYAKQSPAKDILYVVDACYSGLGIIEKPKLTYDEQNRGVDYSRLKNVVLKRARNIISAGGKNERAVDGLFTGVLNQGLLGAADYNHDGYVTFTELGLYVKKNVSEKAKFQYQREQNPQFGSIISDRGECAIEQKKD